MDENKLKVLNHYHVVFLVQNVMVGTSVLSLPQSIKFHGLQPVVDAFVIWRYRKHLLIPMIWLGLKYRQRYFIRHP